MLAFSPISTQWFFSRYLQKCFNFYSDAPEFASPLYYLLFFMIKYAGFKKLKG